jgi:hypothetical protein
VWAALVAAGADFGLKQGAGLAYPTTALETGWIPFPVPAIYTDKAMRGYREHLGPDTLEVNYALAGSQVHPAIEDYYVTPWDIGYGRLVHLDHDFIGRDALKERAEQPHAQKVWLRWNSEDCARVLADSLFNKPGQGRTKYIAQPFSDYSVSQNDRVLADGTGRGAVDLHLIHRQHRHLRLDRSHRPGTRRRRPGADADLGRARRWHHQPGRRTTRPSRDPSHRQHRTVDLAELEVNDNRRVINRRPAIDHRRRGFIGVERNARQ